MCAIIVYPCVLHGEQFANVEFQMRPLHAHADLAPIWMLLAAIEIGFPAMGPTPQK